CTFVQIHTKSLTSRLPVLSLLLPLCSILFPYTTLFRSGTASGRAPPRSPPPPPDCPVNRSGRSREQGVVTTDQDAPTDRELLARSEEHTSELQSRENLVCRLLLEKKKIKT